MPVVRILSIDGYGVDGDAAHLILARLSEYIPDLVRSIDLYAGSSSGGLLAIAMAAGIHPQDFAAEFSKNRSRLQDKPLLKKITSLNNLVGAEYNARDFKRFLESLFGDRTIASLERRVLIPIFDLDNEAHSPGSVRMWKMKFINNSPGFEVDKDRKLVDVALASISTPSLLPIYQGYVDGSVGVSHPGLCAISEVLDSRHSELTRLNDIRLLSISGGEQPRYIQAKDENWGLTQWLPQLLTLSQSNRAAITDFQCRALLGQYYFRLAPSFPASREGDPSFSEYGFQERVIDEMPMEPVTDWIKRYFLT